MLNWCGFVHSDWSVLDNRLMVFGCRFMDGLSMVHRCYHLMWLLMMDGSRHIMRLLVMDRYRCIALWLSQVFVVGVLSLVSARLLMGQTLEECSTVHVLALMSRLSTMCLLLTSEYMTSRLGKNSLRVSYSTSWQRM